MLDESSYYSDGNNQKNKIERLVSIRNKKIAIKIALPHIVISHA